VSHPRSERHRRTLDGALQAIAERGYWSLPVGKPLVAPA